MYQNPYYGMNGNNNQPQSYNAVNQVVNNQTISDKCLRTFSSLFKPEITQELYSALNIYQCSIENFDYHNSFNCFLMKLKLPVNNPAVPYVLFNIIMFTKDYPLSYPILSLELPSDVTINPKYKSTFNDEYIINQTVFLNNQSPTLSNIFYCIHWYITQNDLFILPQPVSTSNQFIPQQQIDPFKDQYKFTNKQDFETLAQIIPKFGDLYEEYFSKLEVPFFDEKQITNLKSIKDGDGLTCSAYTATLNERTICVKIYNNFNQGIDISSKENQNNANWNYYMAVSFFREVSGLLSLSHPYILKSYGISIYNGKPCLLSEYCELKTIRTLYSNQCPQQCREHRFDYMMQIVLAIDYIHYNGKMHRDLKYNNIFIRADGSVCIGDFGMTREIKDYFATLTTTVGTPEFNAPEVDEGKGDYNQKADIYSLGIVLLFIITKIDLAAAVSIENMSVRDKKENQKDGFQNLFSSLYRQSHNGQLDAQYYDYSYILQCFCEKQIDRPDSEGLFNNCLKLYSKYSNVNTEYYKQMKDYYRSLTPKSTFN